MPRDLFGDVTRPSVSIGTRKWYTVPVSLLSHSAIVLAVVVIPLMATDMVPKPWETMKVVIDVSPVPPPPPPPDRREHPTPPADRNIPPTAAPEGIAPEKPVEPREPFDNRDSVIVGDPDAVESIISGPPPAVVAPPPQPLRVGGAIRVPVKVREVAPVYPAIAQAARVQGIVIIEAIIGEDGQVINARLLRSVPLLDQAALDAVRQWQYTPTLLNGVRVPVIMSVTVQFTLQ